MTWYNGSWNYRKPITINNNSGDTLTAYQINVTVTYVTTKMNTDFSDIRFAYANGTNIPYWIESKTNSSIATVWIKVNLPNYGTSPTGDNIAYLYYGNPSATSASSDSNTFISAISGLYARWNYDEASGVAIDNTGNGYNGTLSAGVTRVATPWGTGGHYRGAYVDYINYGTMGGWASSPSSTFSVHLKVKFDAVTAVTSYIVDKYAGALAYYGQWSWELWRNSSNHIVFTLNRAQYTDNNGISSTTVSAGVWYDIVATYNGTTGYIYINGTLDGTSVANPGGSSNSRPFTTGALAQMYATGVDTTIDSVDLFSSAMTSTEAANLANTNYTGYMSAGKLLIHQFKITEPTVSTIGTEELNITATLMTISQSETPCRTGICTITANVTWQNLGSSSVTFRPKILIDGVTYVQATSDITIGPYPLTGSSSITTPTLSTGIHSICPYPN
jgi:hypothetical protein